MQEARRTEVVPARALEREEEEARAVLAEVEVVALAGEAVEQLPGCAQEFVRKMEMICAVEVRTGLSP